MVAVGAFPAFAAGKNPPTSCGVGNPVSNVAKTEGGLGNYFKASNDNPGKEIQLLREFDVDPVCHLDDPGQTP
jgi:hypothetical protein